MRKAKECYLATKQAAVPAASANRVPEDSSTVPSSRTRPGDSVLTLDTLEILYPEKPTQLETRDEVEDRMRSPAGDPRSLSDPLEGI